MNNLFKITMKIKRIKLVNNKKQISRQKRKKSQYRHNQQNLQNQKISQYPYIPNSTMTNTSKKSSNKKL